MKDFILFSIAALLVLSLGCSSGTETPNESGGAGVVDMEIDSDSGK